MISTFGMIFYFKLDSTLRCSTLRNASSLASRNSGALSNAKIGKPNSVDYVRIDADLLIGFGACEIELAVAMHDEAAIDAGGGRVRVEFYNLIEIGNRSITATLFMPG
jgi:hypothetical protein